MSDHAPATAEDKAKKLAQKKKEKKERQGQSKAAEEQAARLKREQEIAQATQANKEKRQNLEIDRVPARRIPHDVDWDTAKQDPRCKRIVDDMLQQNQVHALKGDSLYLARNIWFNELDRNYTFNRKYKQCRRNFAVLNRRYDKMGIDSLHELELVYLMAVLEFDLYESALDITFECRDMFIKLWCTEERDLCRFNKEQLGAFDNMEQRLSSLTTIAAAASLPHLPSTPAQAAMFDFSTIASNFHTQSRESLC